MYPLHLKRVSSLDAGRKDSVSSHAHKQDQDQSAPFTTSLLLHLVVASLARPTALTGSGPLQTAIGLDTASKGKWRPARVRIFSAYSVQMLFQKFSGPSTGGVGTTTTTATHPRDNEGLLHRIAASFPGLRAQKTGDMAFARRCLAC